MDSNSHAKTILGRTVVVLVTGAIVVLLPLAVFFEKKRQEESVLSSGDLFVQAQVDPCELAITIYPERRIPTTNNWDTTLDIDIYDQAASQVVDLTENTSTQGEVLLDLCAEGVDPDPGLYDYYLRGKSHLRKLIADQQSFGFYRTEHDFTSEGDLLGGETSPTFDNFINSLDLSTQVKNLYGTNDKNDINQDGVINGLDLSITANNFYTEGD